jgi:hypothetical protein
MTPLRTLRLAAAAALTIVATGCATPPVVSLGQPVTLGTVSATVTGVELAVVDLEGPTGAAPTAEPVLLVSLAVQNAGPEPVRYDLAWGTTTATQAQTALLFVDPGEEIVLSSAGNIPVLQLAGWEYPADPVAAATRVEPGQTLQDVLLFQAPPADATSLLLSLPPGLFGIENKLPAYVRIPFTRPEAPRAPAPGAMGEEIAGDGFSLRVDGVEQAYARLTNAQGRGGFSTTPLLRLNLTLRNTGDSTIEFVPERANRSIDPPSLTDPTGAPLERATFDDGVAADGLIAERRQIGAGESLQTFLLFKRPDPSVTQLSFTFPGKRVGATGLIRVTVPYAHVAEIPEPPEMNPEPIQAPAPDAPATP